MKEYKNISEFSRAFKSLIWTKKCYTLLDEYGCGWLDGGCRSLMDALKIWLSDTGIDSDEEVTTYTYQMVKSESQEHSEHALLRVGNYFIDGDGVSTQSKLIYRWMHEEHMSNVVLREFNFDNEPYYISDSNILLMAKYLDKRFDKKNVLSLLRNENGL